MASNARILPQTKFCTLCSAKFTRTTHLNRHIRSHTNQRKFECDTCDSKFTRSDLLARHKRSCGLPNGPGSRRKSCQECARSKIKCDLQEPCTKCAERGRQCIYLNDPQVSLAKLQARRPSQSETTSPIQPSTASSSRSAAPPSPPNYDSSASPYTSPEGSPIPGHVGPANNSYDVYDTFAWMADGTTTPLSSPGWTEVVPPTTPLAASLPSSPIDPFAAQFSNFAGPLPTHNDGSLLSPDELHEVMNCPFSGPCYHAGGACLCHTPLNPNELQALLSSTLTHAGQYALSDGFTSQMAPMSYPMASHGATYPMATGPEANNSGMSYGVPPTQQYHPTAHPPLQFNGTVPLGYPAMF